MMSNLWGLKVVLATGKVKAEVLKAPSFESAREKAEKKYKDCEIVQLIQLSR